MKKYVIPGIAYGHMPENPDRTARRVIGWDTQFQVWPNRKAMARSIRMQQSRAPRQDDWKACIALGETEGY